MISKAAACLLAVTSLVHAKRLGSPLPRKPERTLEGNEDGTIPNPCNPLNPNCESAVGNLDEPIDGFGDLVFGDGEDRNAPVIDLDFNESFLPDFELVDEDGNGIPDIIDDLDFGFVFNESDFNFVFNESDFNHVFNDSDFNFVFNESDFNFGFNESDFNFDFENGNNSFAAGLGGLFFGNLDGELFDYDSFDWSNIDWGQGSWGTYLLGLGKDLNYCSLMAKAAEIGESFGVDGGCACEGDLETSVLDLKCSFENQCLGGENGVCGSIGLDWHFGDTAGEVSTESCVEIVNDQYKKICFAYDVNVSGGNVEQTCNATYDGNDCLCTIEDNCLSMNCSAYLPGLVTDNCQVVQSKESVDAASFIPKFRLFEPDFEGLSFEDINFGTIDWNNFDWESFNFSSVIWGERGWADLFSEQSFDDLTICPVLREAAAISEPFGVAADCTCDGSSTEDLNIACSFEDCAENTDICGSVNLNYSFEKIGVVSTEACAQDKSGRLEEVCFGYEIKLDEGLPQSCTASYDDQSCSCAIDAGCLSIDCSMYLPGAKMETCQALRTVQAQDVSAFVPRFQIYNENFTGFNFENVDWESLDWNNLDWKNFNLEQVDFSSTDISTLSFEDIFKFDATEVAVCPILRRVVDMSDDFGETGKCTCGSTDISDGLALKCNFEQQCTDDDLCGTVDVDFAFDDLGAVDGNICVDFEDDPHPKTCVSYKVPIADRTAEPTCTASYGGKTCTCEINEGHCVKVDCSAHEATAITDTCQEINLQATTAEALVPRFALPGSAKNPDNKIPTGENPPQGVDIPPGESGAPSLVRWTRIPLAATFLAVVLFL